MAFKNDQFLNLSPYEQSRNERIKENLERMQKLGIADLSAQLKSFTTPPKRTPRTISPSSVKLSSSSGPTRRSSRLHNGTPVSYSEAALAKNCGLWEDKDLVLEEGTKPEIYTEEHEKLLGNTETSWTLFVDGYGKDGKRIYDPVNGKTCHQCRQKTMGYRTHCCKCQMVQGQFCGDCLYMRYGEHVLEALENPDWICPVCRGICNCSLCRHGKGWAPTGYLYRKVVSMGYKSVAHYLIKTRRSQNTEEKSLAAVNQVSAKRSLPFAGKESPQINGELDRPQKPQSEDTKDDESMTVKEEQLPNIEILATDEVTRSLPFPSEAEPENMESAQVIVNCDVQKEHKLASDDKKQLSENGNFGDDGQSKKEIPVTVGGAVSNTLECTTEVQKGSEKDELLNNGSLNSDGLIKNRSLLITGSEEQSEIVKSTEINQKVVDFESEKPMIEDKSASPEFKGEVENQDQSKDKELGNSSNIADSSLKLEEKISDAKQEQGEKEKELDIGGENKNANSISTSDKTSMVTKKSVRRAEPNPDSIGGRLRQRRRISKGVDDENEIDKIEKEMGVKGSATHGDTTSASAESPIVREKSARSAEPNPDSIGGRLRQRRGMRKGGEAPEANE